MEWQSGRSRQWRSYCGAGLVGATVGIAQPVWALPSGGTVVQGNVTFTTSPNRLEVNQGTERAIIEWTNFSVFNGNTVQFNQPGPNAAILNRVVGTNPSIIAGTIHAPGWVFIVNPNGIGFIGGAQINVGGLVASTLNISNNDFLGGSSTNPFLFSRTPNPLGQGITIERNANITADRGALFLAPGWENKGSVRVNQGALGVAVGDQVQATIDLFGNGLLTLSVEATTAREVQDIHENPLRSYINQQGQLITQNGGNIALVAHSNEDLIATALRNVIGLGGTIEARTAEHINGEVVIRGLGQTSVTNYDPSRYPSHDRMTIKGNEIEITGNRINLHAAHIEATQNISIGTSNHQLRNVSIAQPAVPTKDRLTLASNGLVKSERGDISIKANSEVKIENNPIQIGGTGKLSITGEAHSNLAPPLAVEPAVSLWNWREIITATGDNIIDIQGTQKLGNAQEPRIGVEIYGTIQQNRGNLSIKGEVTGFDPETDYRSWDANLVFPQVVGVRLDGSIIQEEGTMSILGKGITGIDTGLGIEIQQNNGSNLLIEAQGRGSLGGFFSRGPEGFVEMSVTAHNSQINIHANNYYPDAPAIKSEGIRINGTNTGITINAGNTYTPLDIRTSNKNIEINTKNLKNLDGGFNITEFDTSIATENSDITLNVTHTLGVSTIRLHSENGNIALRAQEIASTIRSLSVTNSGDKLIQILTDKMDRVPLDASGEGVFQIGAKSGVGMNINHSEGGEMTERLNVSAQQLAGVHDNFREIVFGNRNTTGTILVSNDQSSLVRTGDIRLENRGNPSHQIQIKSNIQAANITIATDGQSNQATDTALLANQLTFVGNGNHTLENNQNNVQTIRGEARTITFNNGDTLTVEDLTIGDNLKLTTQRGILEIPGRVTIGNEGILTGADGILQGGTSEIVARRLDLLSSENIDLHRGNNAIEVINAQVGGGIYIKNEGKFNNLETRNGDMILAGTDLQLSGTIKAGTDQSRNVILDGNSVRQEANAKILAKGLGVRTRETASLTATENEIETFAGEGGTIAVNSQKNLTVNQVKSVVPAVASGRQLTDTLDEIVVTGVNARANARIQTAEQLLIQEPITAGNTISLAAKDGILQNPQGTLQASGLEVVSQSPVDLGHSNNNIERIAAQINSVGENGLIFKNSQSITVDNVGNTSGIISNSDVILETSKDIQINAPILLGRADIFLGIGGNVNQTANGFIAAQGIGIVADGYADLRNSSNQFEKVAAQVGQGITIASNQPIEVTSVQAKVNRVTPTDTDDLREVTGITAQDSDIIMRSPSIIINKNVAGKNVSLLTNGIRANQEILADGLGIQGTGNSNDYEFPIPARIERLATENNAITVRTTGTPRRETVVSQVNTDKVTTNNPPPAEPPVSPPPAEPPVSPPPAEPPVSPPPAEPLVSTPPEEPKTETVPECAYSFTSMSEPISSRACQLPSNTTQTESKWVQWLYQILQFLSKLR